MKVLITGASGMLGRSVLKNLNETSNYECIGTGMTRANPPLRKLDLLNPDAITQLMNEWHPNVVVHCAAERFPDRASADPKRTIALNVDSSKKLAEECGRIGASLIYISTDYVFDGGVQSGQQPPYLTDSKTMPINIYGESKLGGEEAVLSVKSAQAVVVRIPVLYATDCQNLDESATLVVAKSLLAKETTYVDHWGIRFPTLVDDIAKILKLIIDGTQRTKNKLGGIKLHVSSPERCTKYELAKLMAEIVSVDASKIKPNSSPPEGAPRPQNTQLDCTETWEALGVPPHEFIPLRKGVEKALAPFKDVFHQK